MKQSRSKSTGRSTVLKAYARRKKTQSQLKKYCKTYKGKPLWKNNFDQYMNAATREDAVSKDVYYEYEVQ